MNQLLLGDNLEILRGIQTQTFKARQHNVMVKVSRCSATENAIR